MGKTFLGISYILQGIPYVNIVGFILVPIAWLVEGFKKRRGLWVGAGIAGIAMFGFIIAGVIYIIQALHIPYLFRYIGMGAIPSGTMPKDLVSAINGLNPALFGSLLIIAVGVLLGIIYFILMLISIFQAGNMYSSAILKVGGILYVVDVVLLIIVVSLIMSAFASHPPPPSGPQLLMSLGGIYASSIIAGVLALVASLITGIGFLLVREKPGSHT